MSSLRWTHQTTAKIAGQLDRLGIRVGARTVARLLDKLHFSLRVHCKKIAAGNRSTRDQQSATLPGCAVDFCRHRNPIVSVDAKKRELLGNFKNAGRKWQRIPTPLTAVLCSSSSVTRPPPLPSLLPLVAPGGCRRYPNAKHLPILADTGGSNSATHGGWKDQLQQRLCDRLGLTVTVAHYPTGASKYNPIDAACSVKSARTGPPSLSPAMARSSVWSANPPPPRDSKCAPTWTR